MKHIAVLAAILLGGLTLAMIFTIAGINIFIQQAPLPEKPQSTLDKLVQSAHAIRSPRYEVNETTGEIYQYWGGMIVNGTESYQHFNKYGKMVDVYDYGNLVVIKYYTSSIQSTGPDIWRKSALNMTSDYIGKGFMIVDQKLLYETELYGIFPGVFTVNEITLQKLRQ